MTKLTKIAAFALLFLGVLLGVMAFISARNPASQTGPVPDNVKKATLNVVVAARDIPAGHEVTAEDLAIEKMSHMPASAFGTTQLVQGRRTAVEIAQGQAILATSMMDGLAGLLAPGERAVAIKVDEASAVGHKLKPGDLVDVFAVLRKDGQEVDTSQARMLLPNKKVLAYGALIQSASQAEPESSTEKKNDVKNAPARTAVLAIQVEEVNRLLLAEQYGQVQLALRGPLDHNEPSADILKQVAAVSVAAQMPSYVDAKVAALDASLMGLTMGEFSKRPGNVRVPAATAVKVVRPKATGITTLGRAARSDGMHVEVIRGTRKEAIRY